MQLEYLKSAIVLISHNDGSSYGELAIMRGSIVMTNQNYGRLKMYWRVTGAATGTSSSTATLTSTPPYGGGYP